MSAFEDQESAAGCILAGASLGFKVMPSMQIGAEFQYPFGYKFEGEDEGVKWTATMNQMLVGAFAKFFFGSGNIMPFVKAGLGYYMGNMKWEGGGMSGDEDVESKIGFNFGGGVLHNSGFFAEFNYHMVTREDASMNAWAAMVGYQIIK